MCGVLKSIMLKVNIKIMKPEFNLASLIPVGVTKFVAQVRLPDDTQFTPFRKWW